MRTPDGAVAGLCTASGVILSIGFTFFGQWAHDEGAWRPVDLIVVVPSVAGFLMLGFALYTVLRPVKREGDSTNYGAAWWYFAWGLVLLAVGLFLRWVPEIWRDLTL